MIGGAIFFALLLICFGFAALLFNSTSSDYPDGPRVAVVEVEGVIVDATKTIRQLRRVRRDDQIRAVVVRVDSPGGAVGPSQEIHREIQRLRKKKPVVASLGSVAASGGYYVAAACDRIVASGGTITGSIGVISQMTEFHRLLELARVDTNVIKSGKFKDTGSPLREMTEADRALLQRLVDRIHGQFVRDVAKARRIKRSALMKVADGRVLTGEDALHHELIDEIGNLSDALDLAAELAKAEGEPVAVFPSAPRGLLRRLIEGGLQLGWSRLRGELSGGARIELRDPRLSP